MKQKGNTIGCASKLHDRRGKPQILATMFPLTRIPFWYRFFEPQPYVVRTTSKPKETPLLVGSLRGNQRLRVSQRWFLDVLRPQ